MSEEVAPPAAPVPSPAPVAAPAAPVASNEEPHWLKPRLERAAEAERARILADLGVDDPKVAKAAIEAAKKAAEEQKTVAEKAAEAASLARSAQKEAERLRGIATEHAARMIAVLTAEQQAAVKALAGEDPAEQLKAIGVLGPTWAKEAAAARPPATTAPAATAPAEGGTTSPPDHKAIYTQLQSRNPFEAAAYGLEHIAEVFPQKTA